jgi:uncharacterized protein DUF4436
MVARRRARRPWNCANPNRLRRPGCAGASPWWSDCCWRQRFQRHKKRKRRLAAYSVDGVAVRVQLDYRNAPFRSGIENDGRDRSRHSGETPDVIHCHGFRILCGNGDDWFERARDWHTRLPRSAAPSTANDGCARRNDFLHTALRGLMPGAPPLGVHADLLVLVWVQLAVILGLSLFVITWVSRR